MIERIDKGLCLGGIVVHTYIDARLTPLRERKVADPMEALFVSMADRAEAHKVALHTHETYLFDGDSGILVGYQKSLKSVLGRWETVAMFMGVPTDA